MVKFILKFNFENYIGYNLKANTLVDILNDEWGLDISKHVYHTNIKPKLGYEEFYTWNRHPSELGHKKIADWFILNTDWLTYIDTKILDNIKLNG